MSQLSPNRARRSAAARIASIDAEMIEIQRQTATRGGNLRARWDELFAERSALEQSLWDGARRQS